MAALVSILIPAYNAERWINETMASAIDQTWPNKEIILVDDGSSDNTLQMAKRFESRLVKVISQVNLGSCAARNRALENAQGDYIQWLDHDDILDENKISKQMKEAEKGEYSRILYSGSFGRFYYRREKAKVMPDSLWKDLTPLEYFLIKFSENTWLHPSTWLVSRRLTEMAGPWYEIRSPDDDGEYFSRVVAASERIRFVGEAKSFWRIGNYGSLSQNMSESALEARYKSICLCIHYLRAIEDSERTRRASIKFLQTWLIHMYPEQVEITQKMSALAEKLGGELSPPEISWKYGLFKDIFGWKTAKKLCFTLPKVKTMTYKYWDKIMYNSSIIGKRMR